MVCSVPSSKRPSDRLPCRRWKGRRQTSGRLREIAGVGGWVGGLGLVGKQTWDRAAVHLHLAYGVRAGALAVIYCKAHIVSWWWGGIGNRVRSYRGTGEPGNVNNESSPTTTATARKRQKAKGPLTDRLLKELEWCPSSTHGLGVVRAPPLQEDTTTDLSGDAGKGREGTEARCGGYQS